MITSLPIRTIPLHLLSPSSSGRLSPRSISSRVDRLATSLLEEGLREESHAILSLYEQSFKDPGSRELLDALLRNETSERQELDFRRYVQDVEMVRRAEELPQADIVVPVVVMPSRKRTAADDPVPGPAQVDDAAEGKRRKTPNSSGKQREAAASAAARADSPREQAKAARRARKPRRKKQGILSLREKLGSAGTADGIKKRRGSSRRRSKLDLSTIPSVLERDENGVASVRVDRLAAKELRDKATRRHHGVKEAVSPRFVSIPRSPRGQHRRKLFHGNNGPVLYRSALFESALGS